MSGHLASLAVLAGLWLLLALLASLATPLVWPVARRLARDRSPDARTQVAWLAAAAPVLLPSIVVGLCALPGLAGALLGLGDHCAAHGEHPHFCAIHATHALPPSSALVLVALAPIGLPLVAGLIRDLRRGRRESRWLRRRRLDSPSPGVHRLDTPLPIALTHGLVRPQIWIARSLDAALTPAERVVVLAHERAHATRRDPARLAFASLASRLHRPAFRGRILSALRLAAEQACDAEAARAVGDPLRVASTLLRVERLLQGAPSALRFAAPLLDASLSARIDALLAREADTTTRGARTRWLLGSIAAALLLARPLHHVAEHALDAVLRSMVGTGGLF